jgi:hypothetical protein
LIYGFDTEDEHAATAALLVYVVYRSRDKKRFKVSPDMWERIERYVKDSSKRAKSLAEFIEVLKAPRHLYAGSLHPRWMDVGMAGEMPIIPVMGDDGKLAYAIQFNSDRDTGRRDFLVRVMERADHRAVIRKLYSETAWCIALVRDRLERERPIEERLNVEDEFDVIDISPEDGVAA